jgi:hypothetical protein
MTHPDLYLANLWRLYEAKTRLDNATDHLGSLLDMHASRSCLVDPADLETAREAALERLEEATDSVRKLDGGSDGE